MPNEIAGGPGFFPFQALQALYHDHANPIGFLTVITALSQVAPCNDALVRYRERFVEGTGEWELPDQDPSHDGKGLKFQRGQGSITKEMGRTRDGEASLLLLSFLLHCMTSKTVSRIVDLMAKKLPEKKIPVKAPLKLIEGVVVAVETQTSSISWHEELSNTEEQALEAPHAWPEEQKYRPSMTSYEMTPEAMARYIELLGKIPKFAGSYCYLETTHSITVPLALAQSICGLKVCVKIDGHVVHGSPVLGDFQVLLNRITTGTFEGTAPAKSTTHLKFVLPLEDPQEILKSAEIGPPRANRIPVKGIGKAVTINRGMEVVEARDLAVLAIILTRQILFNLKRDISRTRDDTFNAADIKAFEATLESLPPEAKEAEAQNPTKWVVEIHTRMTTDAVALWWGCGMDDAANLIKRAEDVSKAHGSTNHRWESLSYNNLTLAKLADFEALDENEKRVRASWMNLPVSPDQYSNLMRTLTTQLILISFLGMGPTAQTLLHVRIRHDPVKTPLGDAIKQLQNLRGLGMDDILNSWYIWVKGSHPPKYRRADSHAADGYMIYRSLLFDQSLKPNSCELVLVEPGFMTFNEFRLVGVLGALPENTCCTIYGKPRHLNKVKHYLDSRTAGKLQIDDDETGHFERVWRAFTDDDDDDDSIPKQASICLELREMDGKNTRVSVSTSIYELARRSWSLRYATDYGDDEQESERNRRKKSSKDRGRGSPKDIRHSSTGTTLIVQTAGSREVKSDIVAGHGLTIYKSYNNELGQLACLCSMETISTYGMVRQGGSLESCLKQALAAGVSFVID